MSNVPLDTPRAATNKPSVFSRHIGTLNVLPHQQPHMRLGIYDEAVSPKGFSIAIEPSSEAKESIVTEITTLTMGKRYELVLQVANYGDTPVKAEVWAL